jgi:hypothetical protein
MNRRLVAFAPGHSFRLPAPSWPLAAFVLLFVACGGGGGGSSAYDAHGVLLSVSFPDSSGAGGDESNAPDEAPLVQQVVFKFSGRPDPNLVDRLSLPIADAAGLAVPGRYDVEGDTVTFTPQLPTRPITAISETQYDPGGSGLAPGHLYYVRASPSLFRFESGADPQLLARHRDPLDARGVLIAFTTTSDPARFFAGLPLTTPELVATDPADGATGVTPELWSDPDRHFPPRIAFRVTLDAPVNPAPTNVEDGPLALIDLDDRAGPHPDGLPLGFHVAVVENELDRCVLEITPSGILPFGHLLALELPQPLAGLSQGDTPGPDRTLAATFTVASAPPDEIADALIEEFDTNEREDQSGDALPAGTIGAEWNLLGSTVLQPGFTFAGDGELGRFVPAPPADSSQVHQITLDTSRQVFPLFDGSTPDAPPGFEVVGGVFAFTDVDIPAGVVITPIGANPLVLTATGSIRIAGSIILDGLTGTPENANDSAVTSVPGGPGGSGGGRGGEGHPVLFFPPDQVSYLSLVSPPFGGRGIGPKYLNGLLTFNAIGGQGGQSGALDHEDGAGNYTTDVEITCNEFLSSNSCGEKVAGGGGGSFLVKGKSGGAGDFGIGNVLATGTGGYEVRPYVDFDDPNVELLPGGGGDWPFYNDGDQDNDFIGAGGQVPRILGGQGGGAGGSKIEAYYCGHWCIADSDPANDAGCLGGEFNNGSGQPQYADSVGDARAGGAGGGGGGLLIQALGPITLTSTGLLSAIGGAGAGGEALGCAYWGAASGGGSGGAIVVQSATSITIGPGGRVDVTGGLGERGTKSSAYLQCQHDGGPGSGGNGGAGLVQLQVPAGTTATVVDPSGITPASSWLDPTNTAHPVDFTSTSAAISLWFDLGRTIARPPAFTHPAFDFSGLDPQGFVPTDAGGNVVDAAHVDVVCDYLGQLDPKTKQYRPGQEPRSDFIPTNASVRVEFQGGDAVVEGSREVDPISITPWSPTAAIASGHQFLRWRVTLDLTAHGEPLTPDLPRPTVQRVKVGARF